MWVSYVTSVTEQVFTITFNVHVYLVKIMSLPQSLRISVTPPELELISCQQLVEIVPLISMEKTAFISVHTLSFRHLKKNTIYSLNSLIIKYI